MKDGEFLERIFKGFEHLLKFKAKHTIKRVMSDNGGEYWDQDVIDYHMKKKIEIRRSTSCTPKKA